MTISCHVLKQSYWIWALRHRNPKGRSQPRL